MKALCVALLLAVSLQSCSRFTKTGRMDRAYYKHLKQVKTARVKERQRLFEKQTKIPPTPKPSPREQENVEMQPESQ